MTSEQPLDPKQIAKNAVARARTLTALPEAAARAGRIAEDPESSLEELSAAFALDPALCSNLLKVANSALYGLRTEVSSIERAAFVLGRKVLRNVALAASLQTILPKAEIHRAFSITNLWRHSIRTAAAASLLARESESWNPEEAFAAGLIHDLGLLVEIETDRDKLSSIIKEVEKAAPGDQRAAIRELELQCFGADHQLFGSAMCAAWGFPSRLADVAEHHHSPLSFDSPNQKLVVTVRLAEEIAGDCEHGVTNLNAQITADPDLLDCLGLTPERFEALVEIMTQAADDLEGAF
ncbi:MAG: putative nucleotidyltransferase with HDIG domain [Glaciecola sp.]|jgi:putative nucleotidyltransferase with HDIG domain